jgi:hypothetical protein
MKTEITERPPKTSGKVGRTAQTPVFIGWRRCDTSSILLHFFVETRVAPAQCQFMVRVKSFRLHCHLSGASGRFIISAVLCFAPKHTSQAYGN